MREDDFNFKDFDLRMRSILEDAEEEAPRGVWKAVYSRLSQGAACRKSKVWKWAGAALALACAAGALIVIPNFGTGTRPDVVAVLQSETMETTADNTLSCEDVTDVEDVSRVVSPKPSGSTGFASLVLTDDELSSQDSDACMEVQESSPLPTEDSAESGDNAPQTQPVSSSQKKSAEEIASEWRYIKTGEDFSSGKLIKKKTLVLRGTIGGNESDQKVVRGWMGTEGSSSTIQETGVSSFGVPFTLGVGTRLYLTDKFALGTGLSYSLLTRTFDGSYQDKSGSVSHNVHYLGIPLNAYYDLMVIPSTLLYVYGGAQADWCIANRYTLWTSPSNVTMTEKVNSIQWSAGIGFGVEFKLAKRIGLYMDPGVRYYFHSEGQPKTSRTTKPLQINLEAGLRFDI